MEDQILAETIIVEACGTRRLRSRHHSRHRHSHSHHQHPSHNRHSIRRRESGEDGRNSSQDIIISVRSEEYDPQDSQILSQHESRMLFLFLSLFVVEFSLTCF